jgi:hypothetical protein
MTSGMSETPASVKTLRRYWKYKLGLPDPVKLADELSNESDRAAVIISATILDDTLTRLLAKRFTFTPDEKQFDYIFRYEGPLGAFSHRIEVAHLFGFIDDITRGQLDDIREMRNACAHSSQPMNFGTKELANVARRFFKANLLPLPTDTQDHIRLAFQTEFIILFTILSQGSREKGLAEIEPTLLAAVRAARPPSPDKPPQP